MSSRPAADLPPDLGIHDRVDRADGSAMAAVVLDEPEQTDDTESGSSDQPNASGGLAQGLTEWGYVIVGAVAVALVLRAFLFQAYWIPSESMDATLMTNDRVLVNKISYDVHAVHRGDVVVFERTDAQPGEIRDLIKRVIALEGETIEGRANQLFINGELLIEPYLAIDELTTDFGPVTVPDGHVFMMGDNRDESFDSRFFGTVDADRIVGRAFVIFWPFSRAGAL